MDKWLVLLHDYDGMTEEIIINAKNQADLTPKVEEYIEEYIGKNIIRKMTVYNLSAVKEINPQKQEKNLMYEKIKKRIGEESTGTGYILVGDALDILEEELEG